MSDSGPTTQTNSGLGSVKPGPGPELNEDLFNRNEEVRYDTPRRYEEDDEESPTSDPH